MSNRLAAETSPYLRQHAENPVAWYPWGDEALTLARDTGRPILLSIGYSACHWCHVMAHESFEDPAIARVMNAHFVNIKVDREERPDLDHIYQSAHALLTRRSGGWPLTMFLTPEQQPFFGGTYFPKTARYGLPGFGDLLQRVAIAYRDNSDQIAAQNAALVAALTRADDEASATSSAALTQEPLERAEDALRATFDRTRGGFGDAPKFPHPIELAFLLRRHADTGARSDLDMVVTTLTRMAQGGLFDQLGGGFYRYSVDGEWSIPHFEKMLYDNGLLLALYADTYALTREPLFAETVRATAQWMQGEMQSPEGGYYSSLDADSEHEEGKFYVWTREEIQRVLTADEYAALAPVYGVAGAPNFESRHWHLRIARRPEEMAGDLSLDPEHVQARLASARVKLLAARAARVRPACDDKILTSWNALAITGMARAARLLGEPSWAASARRAYGFIRERLWHEGRLLATYNQGQARLNAYLDDHAFLLAACLELAQTDLQEHDLHFAQALADALLARFEDERRGGFYFTSHDHERLLLRPRTAHDSAQPSGNGIATQALLRLGHLLGEARYIEAAQRCVGAFQLQIGHYPAGHCALLCAQSELIAPPTIVVLRGPQEECADWAAHYASAYRAHTLLVNARDFVGLPAGMAQPVSERALAYVCRGPACLPPTEPAQIEALLSPSPPQ